ncbi:MAG TPA: PAS domain S-box protein, partial [Myxococcaceae bacterium]|nr:PAS domain S-box protein [Myxococcaceae bacterium]
RAILNGVGDAVIGLDAEQRIASINPAGITLFGYEEAELIGQSLAGVLRADRRPPLGVRKDGSRFEAEVTLNPIRLGERRMSIAVVRDVSALHELQARLIASDRMASIGALAAGIVHEINNPLGAVTGNIAYVLQRLVGHVDAVGADTLRALEEAREGADRVARIARDVSALSQREGPADREVDLHEVLESVLRLARPEVERHARLVWQEGSPSSAVEGGRARVGQLLLNLLLYAGRPAEDSPEPRTPRPRTLTVSCRETHGQSAVVEVVDSERSVSEEVRRLMFDPFSAENRVSEAATFNLTVCQRLLTEIGGDLEVDNRPEGGSAFRVRIPAPKLPS